MQMVPGRHKFNRKIADFSIKRQKISDVNSDEWENHPTQQNNT